MENQKAISKTSKKMSVENCPLLDKQDNKTCKELKKLCSVKEQNKDRRCAFSEHFEKLKPSSADMPEAVKIKEEILNKTIEEWKKHTSSGGRHMTARPLEDAVYNAIKNMLGDCVDQRKKIKIGKERNIVVADCLVRKNDRPTSLISIKTWLTTEAIRETFAYAYLIRENPPVHKGAKVFMVTLIPICSKHEAWIKAFNDYIDGVYSLSGKPYIDDLLKELRVIYDQTF